MEQMWAISIKNNTFSVIAIADIYKETVKFQGLLNGVPFTEGMDYEKIRSRVMKAVEINKPQDKEELS